MVDSRPHSGFVPDPFRLLARRNPMQEPQFVARFRGEKPQSLKNGDSALRVRVRSSACTQSAIGAEFAKSLIPGHIPASFPGGTDSHHPLAPSSREEGNGRFAFVPLLANEGWGWLL